MERTIIFLSAIALTATTFSLADAAMAQPAERPERAPMTREAVETRSNATFARLDANHDGVLSKADREAMARKRFDAADTDGNGQLSFEEAMAAREDAPGVMRGRLGEGRQSARMGDGPRGDRSAMREGGPRGMGNLAGIARGADGNDDRQVSQAEFTAAALARFDKADTDGDGKISREERRAMHGNDRPEHPRSGA